MSLVATVLDTRLEGDSTCYLSKLQLSNYVDCLSESYKDYVVQRGFVENVYLDRLVDTVLQRRHIPPIVLVAEKNACVESDGRLTISSFKILDGLQRTIRLQAIRKTIDFCLRSVPASEDFTKWTSYKISRTYADKLQKFDSNTKVLRAVIDARSRLGDEALQKTFTDNGQWFEVWVGLSADEQVRKMLLLNAGHKPVKTRHQLELLFLTLLDKFRGEDSSDLVLLREREISSTQFSKDRVPGHFQFAHVITALLSMFDGRPIAPSADLIQGIQWNDEAVIRVEKLDANFLRIFVSSLVKIDKALAEGYPAIGRLWMGREVSLSGLFGAVGKHSQDTKAAPEDVLKKLVTRVVSHPEVLNLNEFESERNNLDLSKVNIGSVNREAIFRGILSVLDRESPSLIDWKSLFKGPAQ